MIDYNITQLNYDLIIYILTRDTIQKQFKKLLTFLRFCFRLKNSVCDPCRHESSTGEGVYAPGAVTPPVTPLKTPENKKGS